MGDTNIRAVSTFLQWEKSAPAMTQAWPRPVPGPPRLTEVARAGRAKPVSQRSPWEHPNLKEPSGEVAPAQAVDQVPLPGPGTSGIAFPRTGQDKVEGTVPAPLGLSTRHGKKALRPWRAGVGPLVYLEDSQHQAGW